MANAGLPTALLGAVVHNIEFAPAVMGTQFEFPTTPSQLSGGPGSIGDPRGSSARTRSASPCSPRRSGPVQLLGPDGRTEVRWDRVCLRLVGGEVGIGIHWLLTGCFIGNFR